MVNSVVEYFTERGSNVFCASMDMSRAFDNVRWSYLYEDLLNRQLEPLFLRLMLHIYEKQQCQVLWGDQTSDGFSVCNGVRQGGTSSAIFFAIYIEGIIDELKRSKLGCTIFGEYLGVQIFADDIYLLSASRSGLQAMVNLCNVYISRKI